MKPRALLPIATLALLAGGIAAAQARGPDAAALREATREAELAERRSEQLRRQAAAATDEASRARAEAEAVAARIEAAEAAITGAEARLRIIEALRARQRARLAERQAPLARLTAALQTMARRPPALALVQPGSLDEAVRVRALLASTLPVVRERTAALRAEVARGNRLRRQAEIAVAALARSRADLSAERSALARIELQQRRRSEQLASSALFESDRALAFGEEARELAATLGTREAQAAIRASLSELPPPLPRPGASPAAARAGSPRRPRAAPYAMPVEGRVLAGTGELSEAGVHARGVTLAVAADAPVLAPRGGRIAFARPFRSYGQVVVIDHGGGWTTVVTGLAGLAVAEGASVARGALLGRAGAREARVGVELRRNGAPVPIAPLLAPG